mmetsp:Transcript_79634/g.159002  ORF Transcript_79634/g.159002 Transcript_79634/m.159002 type:complete len:281 (+) Transcript_79634:419-1261(+)
MATRFMTLRSAANASGPSSHTSFPEHGQWRPSWRVATFRHLEHRKSWSWYLVDLRWIMSTSLSSMASLSYTLSHAWHRHRSDTASIVTEGSRHRSRSRWWLQHSQITSGSTKHRPKSVKVDSGANSRTPHCVRSVRRSLCTSSATDASSDSTRHTHFTNSKLGLAKSLRKLPARSGKLLATASLPPFEQCSEISSTACKSVWARFFDTSTLTNRSKVSESVSSTFADKPDTLAALAWEEEEDEEELPPPPPGVRGVRSSWWRLLGEGEPGESSAEGENVT